MQADTFIFTSALSPVEGSSRGAELKAAISSHDPEPARGSSASGGAPSFTVFQPEIGRDQHGPRGHRFRARYGMRPCGTSVGWRTPDSAKEVHDGVQDVAPPRTRHR